MATSDEDDGSETGAEPPADRRASNSGVSRGETISSSADDTIPETFSIGDTAPASGPPSELYGPNHPETIDDRYEVCGLLGRGSMGNVYKVFDRELEEIVALKSLHQQFVADDEAETRFRREVKLARRVTHPNVARIYDLGVDGDLPYLTMEYIPGDPMDEVLDREGPFSSGELLDYIEPICKGLRAAHDAEIVHRDLKPQNIMVSESRVAITDFGIARAATRTGERGTSKEGLLGTPAYMAPEQVRSGEEIDARTDIYALGVMLYEMLTGSFPWNETAPVPMAFERCERPAPELPEDGNWPDAYREVVRRCLQRDPDQRYSDVLEVASGLRRASNPAFATYGPVESDNDLRTATDSLRIARSDLSKSVGLESLPSGKTVAVLPFDHVGPEELEYRAVGFTEELLDELSRTDGLAVVPRGAVQPLRDEDIDPRAAGRQLGVQVVVEGSVQQYDGSLHVRVAAVSVEDGFQLWGDRYEVDSAGLLDLGANAAAAVQEALTLDAQEPSYETPSDPLAVDLYMQARHQMHERWFSDLEPAIDLFERALDREPQAPRILSGLATARARAAFVDAPNRQRHLDRAEYFAGRAIDVAPGWPEPRFARAKVQYNRVNFREALDAVDSALDLAPDYAEAHALRGRILAEIGSLETAARHLRRALDLNSYDYNARWDLARVEALRGSWDRVDRLLERPVDSELHRVLRFANRTRLDVWRDDPRWIDAELPQSLPEESDFEQLLPVMRKVTRGDPLAPEDRELLEVATSNADSDSRYLSLQYQFRAEIAARAGDRQYALEALERAVDAGLVDLNWLKSCPALETLRESPTYERVLEAVRERIRSDLNQQEAP